MEDQDVVFFHALDNTCGIVKFYEGGLFTAVQVSNLRYANPEEGCEKMKTLYEFVTKTLGVKS